MKQAHSVRPRYRRTTYPYGQEAFHSAVQQRRECEAVDLRAQGGISLGNVVGRIVAGAFATVWFIVTLPFRFIFWMIAWLGRITALVLGFMLMVLGMALWAGPFFFLGIPLFLIGLVITLRCLD